MRIKKTISLTALAVFILSAALLSECAETYVPGVLKQVNEQSVSMDGITNLEIDFSERDITLLSTKGDTLKIRDLMATDNAALYSAVSVSGDTVIISERQNNRGAVKVEIAIPESFGGTFKMSLASGEVHAKTDLTGYDSISLTLQNGQMIMKRLEAGAVSLDVANGTISTKNTKGDATFNVHSGTIAVLMEELTADLALNVKRGVLYLTLPHNTAFHLNAKANKGTVSVTGADEKVHVSGKTISKTIGKSPEHTITANADRGTVDISVK